MSEESSDGDAGPKRKESDDTPDFIPIPEKVPTPESSSEEEGEVKKAAPELKPESSSEEDDYEIPAMAVYVDDKKDNIEETVQQVPG